MYCRGSNLQARTQWSYRSWIRKIQKCWRSDAYLLFYLLPPPQYGPPFIRPISSQQATNNSHVDTLRSPAHRISVRSGQAIASQGKSLESILALLGREFVMTSQDYVPVAGFAPSQPSPTRGRELKMSLVCQRWLCPYTELVAAAETNITLKVMVRSQTTDASNHAIPAMRTLIYHE